MTEPIVPIVVLLALLLLAGAYNAGHLEEISGRVICFPLYLAWWIFCLSAFAWAWVREVFEESKR